MSKSKYASTAGQMFSRKILAAAVGVFAVALLIIVGIAIFRPSSENGEQVPVTSGSGVTAQPSGQTATAAPETTEASETQAPAGAASPQATLDPNGIAAEIAAVPTLVPQAVPTPEPKPRSKAVALTFDDGPSTENTPKVLELLKQYNAHATFFVVGTRVATGTEVLKQ